MSHTLVTLCCQLRRVSPAYFNARKLVLSYFVRDRALLYVSGKTLYSFYKIKLIGVTVVNNTIQTSSVRLSDTSSVYCTVRPPPPVSSPSVTTHWTPFALYRSLLPPGERPAVVCVCGILSDSSFRPVGLELLSHRGHLRTC